VRALLACSRDQELQRLTTRSGAVVHEGVEISCRPFVDLVTHKARHVEPCLPLGLPESGRNDAFNSGAVDDLAEAFELLGQCNFGVRTAMLLALVNTIDA
jgi:hypothetical protein